MECCSLLCGPAPNRGFDGGQRRSSSQIKGEADERQAGEERSPDFGPKLFVPVFNRRNEAEESVQLHSFLSLKFGRDFFLLYESQVVVAAPAPPCLEQVFAYRKWATTIQMAHGPFPTRRDCIGESSHSSCAWTIICSLIEDNNFRVFGYRGHRRRTRGRSHGADDSDDYVPVWRKHFSLDRMIPSSHPVLISLLLFLVFLGEPFSLITMI